MPCYCNSPNCPECMPGFTHEGNENKEMEVKEALKIIMKYCKVHINNEDFIPICLPDCKLMNFCINESFHWPIDWDLSKLVDKIIEVNDENE